MAPSNDHITKQEQDKQRAKKKDHTGFLNIHPTNISSITVNYLAFMLIMRQSGKRNKEPYRTYISEEKIAYSISKHIFLYWHLET